MKKRKPTTLPCPSCGKLRTDKLDPWGKESVCDCGYRAAVLVPFRTEQERREDKESEHGRR